MLRNELRSAVGGTPGACARVLSTCVPNVVGARSRSGIFFVLLPSFSASFSFCAHYGTWRLRLRKTCAWVVRSRTRAHIFKVLTTVGSSLRPLVLNWVDHSSTLTQGATGIILTRPRMLLLQLFEVTFRELSAEQRRRNSCVWSFRSDDGIVYAVCSRPWAFGNVLEGASGRFTGH